MKINLVLCLFLACVVSALGDGLPVPPYPQSALKAHKGGKVGIKVVYGEGGAIKSVDVTSASGVAALDSTTKKFVQGHWKNPAMANQTMNYTLTFDPTKPGPSVINDADLPPVNDDPTALRAYLPALPPKETALALYQKHIQSVLQYYWLSEVRKRASDVEAGTIKLTYVIHSDGSISDIDVVEGNNLEVLKQVGINVLVAGTPYRPFTPELIEEVGDKYTDTRTFSISR